MSVRPIDLTDFAALNLLRYPSKHAKDLRAWDASDEYLAEFIIANTPVLLINDAFGALHCAAGTQVFHINDSWCSRHAIEINSQQCFTPYSGQALAYGLVKLPKSLSLFQTQLQQVAKHLSKPLILYFSGMQKHVSKGHLDIIKSCCDDVEYLPTQRKARMYTARLRPGHTATTPYLQAVAELGLTLHNAPGVFAEQKTDIGSRFFIEHFDRLPGADSMADVGCGNGLLSLAYHQLHPKTDLHLFDESLAAVESAQLSFAANFPDACCQIQHSDGLSGAAAEGQTFDLILINPPFHQQNTVTTDIALSMFAQAKLCMSANSELWIVANRHLNYQAELKKSFRYIELIAQSAKFVIIKTKR
ncbi:class I SAM-dependent methyltransferase [Iodobacter ciconiae]|uniref:Methyltransferase domain-containing protein n=1 Tax=Iodobacter ciconiae TaxID=2496266 RepID=A0A3S8ZUD3_9NEIS|nr:methyltransferase [Iodobacter ciconiae]AZN37054.1 methyltransferase domain-containing protein [Iodobacter ciconiae]